VVLTRIRNLTSRDQRQHIGRVDIVYYEIYSFPQSYLLSAIRTSQASVVFILTSSSSGTAADTRDVLIHREAEKRGTNFLLRASFQYLTETGDFFSHG